MLVVDSLIVTHNAKTLIGPVSCSITAGQSLVIMGETGAGKSLIAQAIMGTLPPALVATGRIELAGRRIDDLHQKDREALWGRQLAMLPQEPWRALDPLMASFNQVFETHRFVSETKASASRKITEQYFKTLSLQDAKRKLPSQLSGGMGQRVAFAAALIGEAPILLADEPTKGLDANRTDAVMQLLKEVPAREGMLIVITHDASVARHMGGNLLVLKNGAVVESGELHTVLDAPQHDYTKTLIEADPVNWESATLHESSDHLISLESLVAGRNGTAFTPPVDIAFSAGKRVALTGPSGVGKSTLLDTVAGLLKPISGNVTRHTQFSPTDIQKIYQDPPAAFATKVSLKNSLADVAKLHSVAWPTVLDMLKRLGIGLELLDRKPGEVSGGELQRIAIARALIVKPKLLLADEPTSRLDPVTQKSTMMLLRDVTSETGTAVFLVTHDHVIAEKWTNESLAIA